MSYVEVTSGALEHACRKTIKWADNKLLKLKIECDQELVESEVKSRNFWRKLFFMKSVTYAEVYRDLDKIPRTHIDGFGDAYFMKTIPLQMYKMTATRLLSLCASGGVCSVSSEDARQLLWE